MTADMKGDWNRRAVENAPYYIATTNWETTEKFDESGRRDAELFFEPHHDLLDAGHVVLDIGCGIGRMDRHVAPKVGHLIGCDVSGEMIARARERLKDLHNVEFVEVDGWSLGPIADASIDVVFSHIVFQHLPRRAVDAYFREAYRVLKPGGTFLFQVPEAVGEAPAEHPDTETFEMRFHREVDVRRALEALGFEWQRCRRMRIETEAQTFDHIQPRVRRP